MTAPGRNNDLALIHMAKAKLKLADPDYRAILSERYGVLTAAALGPVQRQDLLTEFERRGWKRGWGGKPDARVQARGKDTPSLAKVRALLAAAGKTIEYGDALAKRIAKVERMEWCNPVQIGKLIAALEYDARRREAKVAQLPAALLRLLQERPELDGRVRAMYAGSQRNRRNSADTSAAWVLTALRKEANACASEGHSDGARRDREFMDALGLIGLIDRIRLEGAQ